MSRSKITQTKGINDEKKMALKYKFTSMIVVMHAIWNIGHLYKKFTRDPSGETASRISSSPLMHHVLRSREVSSQPSPCLSIPSHSLPQLCRLHTNPYQLWR